MDETKTLKAICHCRAVHFTVTVPLTSLPLPVHLCHCSRCRYRSGAPCVFHTRIEKTWPVRFVAPSVEDNMTQYEIAGTKSSWAFCSVCGCHVGSKQHIDGSWVISTSMFLDHGTDNFLIRKHIHSASTMDGGLVACMERAVGQGEFSERGVMADGRFVEDWNPDQETKTTIGSDKEVSGLERLRAQCHCGGVSFTIGRPSEDQVNDIFHQRYVSPLDKSKWLATWDVCNDCRLVNGTHVVGWTFVPVSSIDTPVNKDLAIGTSKTYESSPGTLRSFCGTCGATIFFSCDERCPSEAKQVVDIATGILRAAEGVNATNWLTWRPRLAHASRGSDYDSKFCRALEDGMKQWTSERYRLYDGFVEKLDKDI